MESTPESLPKEKVIARLRWIAIPVACLLFFQAISAWVSPPFEPLWFFRARGGIEFLLGVLLLLPFGRIGSVRPGVWKRLFFGLLVIAVVFVFARVIGVMFEARTVEAAGGEMGVPAWSGTLIFLVLAQIPIILFQRFPDQLD